jgi:hypothetical protein
LERRAEDDGLFQKPFFLKSEAETSRASSRRTRIMHQSLIGFVHILMILVIFIKREKNHTGIKTMRKASMLLRNETIVEILKEMEKPERFTREDLIEVSRDRFLPLTPPF